MADYTYEDLKTRTVAELRDIAKGLDHEAVQGYSQLNKEHLLPAICTALNLAMHEEHHVVGDFDKAAVKARMRELKKERQAALEAGDRAKLKAVRRLHRHLNHQVRAHVR
jgi:uncharacterized membrane protein (DUF106 family)